MGDITELQVLEYSTKWDMLVQQTNSRLMPCVTVGAGHVGKQASPVDQWGTVEVEQNTTAFEAMTLGTQPYTRRWVMPETFDKALGYDKFQLQRVLNDPKGVGMQGLVAAMNRRRDLSILSGMFNTNYVGEAGASTQAFGTTQTVSVNTGGTGSKINVAKVRAAFELFLTNEVDQDGDEWYMAIDGENHAALLAEVQVISKEFNSFEGDPVIQNGRLTKLFNFNFVHSERIRAFRGTDDGSGTGTPIPFWAKSGVYFGSWGENVARIDERKDLRGIPWQIYHAATFGATRLQEPKVGRIWARYA